MIRMCIGIHNNNCTNVAEYGFLLCESCEREHIMACNEAKKASKRSFKAADGVLMENTGKEAQEA